MDTQTLIQQYLSGDLDEQSRDAVVQLVENDPDFAEQLQIESVFYAQRNKSLKEKLKAAKPDNKVVPMTPVASTWKRVLSIAATAALLVTAVWVYQSDTSASTFGEITTAYITEKPDAPIITMGAPTENKIWQNATRAYQNNEYQKALLLINDIQSPTEEQVFYKALCLMRSDAANTEDALKIFQGISDQKNALYRDQAMWYEALCLIELDELIQARVLLTEIVKTQSWRDKDAQRILDSMSEE